MRLAERVVLLLTSGDTIGRRLALRLAEEGASLVLATSDLNRGERIVAELEAADADVSLVHVDRKDPGAVQAAATEAVLSFGTLDGLVVMPEGAPRGDLSEVDLETWNDHFNRALRAPYLLCAAALPFLKQNAGASIVLLTGGAETGVAPRQLLASTRDAALGGLVRSLALDAGPHEIRVNALSLGYIETEATRRHFEASSDPESAFEREMAVQPLGRFGRPRDVAHAVVFLLSEESSYLTGVTLPLDGGRHLVLRDLFGS
jgi:meso-butanediol dehydrogenase / (S,S)-butanediol dehydrogenase / diacetyl reductase